MKNKNIFVKIFVICCFIGYVCMSGFLIYHASLDGNQSSQESESVGESIMDLVNTNKGDQTILVEPEEISILNKVDVGYVGKTHQLKCEILPEETTYKSIAYKSSDSKIASISSTGQIKFIEEGKVTITASNKNYPKLSDSFEIEIQKIDLIDFFFTIEQGGKEVEKEDDVYVLKQYDKYSINYTFNPLDASNKDVEYTYDKNFITISNDSIIANKPSTSPLLIEMECEGIKNSFEVKIEETIIEFVDLENCVANTKKITMNQNQKVALSSNPFKVVFTPNSATDKELIYKSLDTDIVEIKNNSLVGMEVGIAQIEVISHCNNIKNIVEVEVKNIIELDEKAPVDIEQEFLSFDESDNSYHIRNGISGTMDCNFTASSTYKNAEFVSSNEKVLLIGDDGVFTPIKEGKATVTIVIDDGHSERITLTYDFVIEKKPFIENLNKFYYFVRKSIGHLGAFFVLGIFGTFAFLIAFDKKKWLFSVPLNLGLGFFVAALTEYIQTLVPGRYGCWDDVWIDLLGFVSAFILISIIIFTIYFISYKTKRRKRKGD